MPPLPPQMVQLLQVFAPAFGRPRFARALVLLCGTLLASGRRAVGLAEEPHFGANHRVLSRAGYPRTGGDAAAAGPAAAGAGGGPAGARGCAGGGAAGRDAGAAAGQADRVQGAVPGCGAVAGAARGDLRGGAVAGAGGAGAAALVPPAVGPAGADDPGAQPGDERGAGTTAPHLHRAGGDPGPAGAAGCRAANWCWWPRVPAHGWWFAAVGLGRASPA